MKAHSISALMLICFASSGCGGGKTDFRNVLVCLESENQVSEYGSFVEAYAKSHGWDYVDDTLTYVTRHTQGDESKLKESAGRESLFAVMESDAGLYVSLTNWGFAETAIAHGFLALSNADSAKISASNFIAAVEERWNVIELPVDETYWPTSCEAARAQGEL